MGIFRTKVRNRKTVCASTLKSGVRGRSDEPIRTSCVSADASSVALLGRLRTFVRQLSDICFFVCLFMFFFLEIVGRFLAVF
jgi:hypothetical protein